MKKLLLVLALPLLQLAGASAFAAAHTAAPADSSMKSRDEVKAETKAAIKADTGTKPGQVGSPATVDNTKIVAPVGDSMKNEAAGAQAVDQKSTSKKSRSQVKAEAKSQNQKEVHQQKGDNMTTGK